MADKKRNQWLGAATMIAAGGAAWLLTKAVVSFVFLVVFRGMGLPESFAAANSEGIGGISGLIVLVIVMDIVRRRTMTQPGKAKSRRRKSE